MITAVTTCMGRREHLEVTLPLMLAEFDHVVVVDWSCPQDSGEWAEEQGAIVVKRRGEKFFDMAKARNIGARNAPDRSLVFIDADNLVSPGVKKEIESLLSLQTMVLAPRLSTGLEIPNLCGFMAVDSGQFWGVGGYTDSLEGYGLEDLYLRCQLRLERELKPVRLSSGLSVIRHSNHMRGRFFKDPIETTSARNHDVLMRYLLSQGVPNWESDPRTSEIAYRYSE